MRTSPGIIMHAYQVILSSATFEISHKIKSNTPARKLKLFPKMIKKYFFLPIEYMTLIPLVFCVQTFFLGNSETCLFSL